MGGPGFAYAVKAEFNAKSHKKGILSAARSANPDSAGSQFLSVWLMCRFWTGNIQSLARLSPDGSGRQDSEPSQRTEMIIPMRGIEMKVKIIEITFYCLLC